MQAESKNKLAKYHEQLNVPGMTEEAQEKLFGGSALILGVSGAAEYAAKNLAAFGLGRLILVDESPRALKLVNSSIKGPDGLAPDTNITSKVQSFLDLNLEELGKQVNVVVESLNDWQLKLKISDACMSLNKPLIHAGVVGFRYQVFSMLPGRSACLRCALPQAGIDDVPLKMLQMGQIQAISEMAGAWQAIECVKIIARIGATQGNELFKFDCLSGEFDILRGLDPRADCPDCGSKKRN